MTYLGPSGMASNLQSFFPHSDDIKGSLRLVTNKDVVLASIISPSVIFRLALSKRVWERNGDVFDHECPSMFAQPPTPVGSNTGPSRDVVFAEKKCSETTGDQTNVQGVENAHEERRNGMQTYQVGM